MSDNVDRRIVEMRFDNEQFEKNVSQTLITLDTLKKALEMSDAGKGFEEVSKAAERVDLSTVQNGVEQTSRQFSAMEVVAITALANITNSAVNAGKRLVASFVNPLFSGGKQRAQNMAQARFMFQGLHYAAEEIGAVGKSGTIMDNLYKSVEGTFYSLDKAALIGSQLMAAGIKGTSSELTEVLKGVAGVASMFGADYQRVGDIFAKVKTQGKLMGQDLMSLNSYGVPTIATITDYLNKMGDGAKYTQEQVSDMVSKGKIDFEIFSGAMSDAFGEQAAKSKQLFTGAVEDMAAAMARIGEKLWTPLLNFGKNWFNATVPVIDNINTALTPAFNLFGKLLDAVSEKVLFFTDAIGAIINWDDSISALKDLTKESLKDVDGNYLVDPKRIEALEKHKELIDKIRAPFLALNKVLKDDSASKYIGSIAQLYGVSPKILSFAKNAQIEFGKLTSTFKAGGTFIIGIAKTIAAVVSGFSDTGLRELMYSFGITRKELGYIQDIVGGVTTVFNVFKTAVITLANAVGNVLLKAFNAFESNTSLFRAGFDFLLSVLAMLGRALSSLERPLRAIVSLASDLGSGVFSIFSTIITGVGSIASDRFKALDDLAISLENFGEKAIPVLKQLIAFGKGAIETVFNEIFKVFGGLGGLVNGILKAGAIAGVWNVLKTIMRFFRTLYEGGILGNLSIGHVFNETRLAIIELQYSLKVMQNTLKAGALLLIASAILELAIAMKIMSTIPAGRLIMASGAIGSLFTELIIATHALKPTSANGLIKLAITIRILANAIKAIGTMETADLIKGVLAISAIMEVLVVIMEQMEGVNKRMALAGKGDILPLAMSLIGMAIAVKLLIGPIQELGSMDLKSLVKGVGAVAVLMGGLVGAMILFSKYLDSSGPKGLSSWMGKRAQIYSLVFSLIMLAAGINLMVKPVKELGAMDVESLKKGLGSVGILLAEIIGFITFFDMLQIEKPSSLLKVGGMMIMLAYAIGMIVGPVQQFASMNAKQLAKGFGSIAIFLGEAFAFMALLNAIQMGGGSMLASAGAIVAMAVGVKILADGLNALSNIKDPGAGLSTLFGSLLILSAAVLALNNAIVGAAALVVVAAGLNILVPALALMSTLDVGKVLEGLLGLGVALAVLGAAAYIITRIPELALGLMALGVAVAFLGGGIFAAATGITILVAAFQSGVDILADGLVVLSTIIPEVATNLAAGLAVFLAELTKSSKTIFEFFGMLWDVLIQTITEKTPMLIDAGMMLIGYLLVAIRDKTREFTILGMEIIIKFIDGISSMTDAAADAALNLVIRVINSIANAISERGPELVAAVENLLLSVLEVIVGAIPGFGKAAADAIKKYREGLTDGKGKKDVEKGAEDLKKTVEKKTELKKDTFSGYGKNVTGGLVSGMGALIPDLRAKANEIANIVDETIRKKNEISSPSKRLRRTGEYLMMGLIAGVDSLASDYQNRADSISTMMIDSFNTSGSSYDINPVINPIFGTADLSQLSASVNLGLDQKAKEERALASNISGLAKSLNSMTDTMNSRSLNVYNTIDGSADPEAFADGLIRSFRLNARTV